MSGTSETLGLHDLERVALRLGPLERGLHMKPARPALDVGQREDRAGAGPSAGEKAGEGEAGLRARPGREGLGGPAQLASGSPGPRRCSRSLRWRVL